jgi:hypothetical protein
MINIFDFFEIFSIQEEMTNVVAGVTVNSGELSIDSALLENGELFRCKIDDQVRTFI